MDAKTLLGMILLIISSGLVAGKIAQKLRIPDIILFILTGILISPTGLGLINIPGSSALSEIILTFGAAYILFDGGVELNLKVLRKVWLTILLLATAGVMVTAIVTGLAVKTFIGIPLIPALLVASIISSTDPATIIPIFKQFKVKKKLAQTIISESAFNDATGAILTFTIVSIITTGKFSIGHSITMFFVSAVGGIVIGAAVGLFFGFLISEHRLGFLDEFSPVVSVIIVISAYVLAEFIHGSGFMAVFVAGIMIGNMDDFRITVAIHYKQRMHHFLETVALIMRIMIFVMLGMQIKFPVLVKCLLPGLAVIGVFMLIARPMTVLLSVIFDRKAKWTRREILFMFWSRETGVIPAALAGLVMKADVPNKEVIASITFLTIMVTIILQGSTTPYLAKRLNLLESKPGSGKS